MNGDHERDQAQRLTLAEAAEVLGTSKDAVRMRVRRDTLPWEKGEDGRVYVFLDPTTNDVHPEPEVEGPAGDPSRELVEELRDRMRSLERMLEEERRARTEERRRHDTLMAQFMQRIPELEAAQEPPEAPETVEEEQERAEPRSDTVGAHGGAQRPWWRRVFGR